MTRYGFVDIEWIDVPFVAEFADPEIFARAMASTGPGYEAIQNVGEAAFADAATNEAITHLRDGLPLRGEVAVVGYFGAHAPGPLRRDVGDAHAPGPLRRDVGDRPGSDSGVDPAAMTSLAPGQTSVSTSGPRGGDVTVDVVSVIPDDNLQGGGNERNRGPRQRRIS
jgi:hypothetical protein